MITRMDSLIANKYSVQRFADLPTHYQLAIVWFMAVDGEAWDAVDLSTIECDDLKPALTKLLPKYVELYGETLFGSIALDATAVQSAVMCDEDISDLYSTWDEYHSKYVSIDTPEHPEECRWPVILSADDYETLRDGWHRFHSYVRDGAAEIPAIFFPKDRHLATHA